MYPTACSSEEEAPYDIRTDRRACSAVKVQGMEPEDLSPRNYEALRSGYASKAPAVPGAHAVLRVLK